MKIASPTYPDTKEREPSTINSSKNFTTRLIRIWEQVQRFKQIGFIENDDDRCFRAYWTAENELREVCEKIKFWKQKWRQLKIRLYNALINFQIKMP